MDQLINQVFDVSATFAKNLVFESLAGETTALEKVVSVGTRNISVSAVCSSGTISSIKLYGSPDGVNWVAVSGYTPFAVAAPNMNKADVVANFPMLRVTTTGVGVVDVYLLASQ